MAWISGVDVDEDDADGADLLSTTRRAVGDIATLARTAADSEAEWEGRLQQLHDDLAEATSQREALEDRVAELSAELKDVREDAAAAAIGGGDAGVRCTVAELSVVHRCRGVDAQSTMIELVCIFVFVCVLVCATMCVCVTGCPIPMRRGIARRG